MSLGRPSNADVRHESIELVVPLHPRYYSTVRVVAAAAGAELGLDVDEIDDLRLGVDEALSLFEIGADGATDGAELCLEFRLEPAGLRVVLAAAVKGARRSPSAADVLGRKVLAAVVDSFESHADHVELFKRRPVG